MEEKALLKEVLSSDYDEELHQRFSLWKEHSGSSLNRISKLLNRSTAAISQYLSQKYEGNVEAVEQDIANLLRREEDLEFVSGPEVFCPTTASRLIYEVLQFCDRRCKMGVIVGPSGTGKTQCCVEYKKQNRATVFVTLDPTTRTMGEILRRIADKTGGQAVRRNLSELLHTIINRLKGSRRMIIVDEAHFLQWEAFELMRKIHDCAGVGVIYLGQERLYDQMKGNTDKAFLFDQIYSRITIKRDDFPIKKADAKMIVESVRPGLDNQCIDYLYKKARGKGRFRTMKDLIDVATEMRENYDRPLNIDLLREAAGFLMI